MGEGHTCVLCPGQPGSLGCGVGRETLWQQHVRAAGLGASLPNRISSVFFGGGTPSLASPLTIAAVLETVSQCSRLAADAEVTLEANPTSAGASRLAGFQAAGVNRLSIGIQVRGHICLPPSPDLPPSSLSALALVPFSPLPRAPLLLGGRCGLTRPLCSLQSVDNSELQLLGRDHTADEALRTLEEAKKLFPGRTSIDLIFGLPGQSVASWARGLERLLQLCDDHVSLYQLTLERGTSLFKQVQQGALPMPEHDVVAEMYEVARRILQDAGFRQYEVSNFARNVSPGPWQARLGALPGGEETWGGQAGGFCDCWGGVSSSWAVVQRDAIAFCGLPCTIFSCRAHSAPTTCPIGRAASTSGSVQVSSPGREVRRAWGITTVGMHRAGRQPG